MMSTDFAWDWQQTIKGGVSKHAIDGIFPVSSPFENIVGYKFAEDAKEKIESVDEVPLRDLSSSQGIIYRTSSSIIRLKYAEDYLSTLKAKRILQCWYEPSCGCCIEEEQIELEGSDNEDNIDGRLPKTHRRREGSVVQTEHAVDTTIWVLGRQY